MKIGHKVLFFLLGTCTLSSCTNDYQDHRCDPIICNQPGGAVHYYDANQVDYSRATFNPQNNEEFVALRIVRGNDTMDEQVSLEIVNYVAGTRQTLLTHSFLQANNISICEISWGSTGWIVFRNCNNNQIYKIADNGAGLQQMSTGIGGYNPCFTYDGTKLFYSSISAAYTLDINTGAYIDTIVDTSYLGVYSIAASFSNNWMITSMGDNKVRIIDGNTLLLIDEVIPNSNIENFNHLNYFDNLSLNTTQVIFLCDAGICKLNIVDDSVILIKSSCINQNISSMCVSPDGTKILYQLDKMETPNDACSIRQQTEFHIMNINGTEDVVLELP